MAEYFYGYRWGMFRALARVFVRAILLIVVAVVLGFIANTFFPSRIKWRGDWEHFIEAQAYEMGLSLIDSTHVRQAVEAGEYMMLDARPVEDFQAGHIPGAISFPAEGSEENEVLYMLAPQDRLLIYCSGYECDDSVVLAGYLQEAGFTNIVIYAGGWSEWQELEGGRL